MEIWRAINGYEGLYEISNLGRIRSLDRLVNHPKGGMRLVRGKIKVPRKPHPKTGYIIVGLYKDGEVWTTYVHRLVAFAFPEICGKHFDGAVVDHLDTIRHNNRAENLRWCTISENHLNPITYEREKINIQKACDAKKGMPAWNKGVLLPNMTGENHWRSKPILQIDKEGNIIRRWTNTQEAAKHFGVRSSLIYNCLTGRSNSSLGFIWKYEADICSYRCK